MHKDICVELCNAVGVCGSEDSHSCHVDNAAVNNELGVYLLLGLTDRLKVLFEVVVYHENDLINCGDNALEQVDVPLFQSLAHNGVVGVVAGLLNDIECFLEGKTFLEHEYSDELSNGNCGVSIVELKSVALCKVGEILAVLCLVASDNVLNGSGYEEILLLKSQSSALFGVIVGVKNIVYGISHDIALGSAHVILVIKLPEIKALNALSLPETESIYSLSVVADDRCIVRNSLYGLICKFNYNSVLVASYAPCVAVIQPGIGSLSLEAVFDRLLEKSVLISDTVAVEGYIAGSC